MRDGESVKRTNETLESTEPKLKSPKSEPNYQVEGKRGA
jgi:hypothetical protein